MCERQKAVWRTRRGLLELDLLLQPFVESHYDSLSRDQQRSLHQLLDLDDVELLEKVRHPGDSGKFKEVIQEILDHRKRVNPHSLGGG